MKVLVKGQVREFKQKVAEKLIERGLAEKIEPKRKKKSEK